MGVCFGSYPELVPMNDHAKSEYILFPLTQCYHPHAYTYIGLICDYNLRSA